MTAKLTSETRIISAMPRGPKDRASVAAFNQVNARIAEFGKGSASGRSKNGQRAKKP